MVGFGEGGGNYDAAVNGDEVITTTMLGGNARGKPVAMNSIPVGFIHPNQTVMPEIEYN